MRTRDDLKTLLESNWTQGWPLHIDFSDGWIEVAFNGIEEMIKIDPNIKIEQIKETAEKPSWMIHADPSPPGWMYNTTTTYPSTEEEVEELMDASIIDKHPYLKGPFKHFENLKPMPSIPGYEPEYVKWPGGVGEQSTVTNEPLFVQNEEQKESDLWTKTAISKEEYFETSAAVNLDPYNDAPHPEIVEYIELVKSKKMALRDVPQEFIMAVKARI